MNIFVLDEDMEKSVQYHVDRHCVKMILEHVQLLCSACHINGLKAPYKLTHSKHPCSIWTRESLSNYLWLCHYTKKLCLEYTYRYGKKHKSEDVLEWCLNHIPNIQDNGLTPFAQAMPVQYKSNNSIQAYRNYYKNEKKHLFKWTKREKPSWLE